MPRAWLVAGALCVGAICWGIGSYPLFEPDEGRNAEVAREMARDGDWVLPHLDGLPYLDKPAPYFAAVALSLLAFGENEAAARLPSLLFTLATALLLWRFGRRLGPLRSVEPGPIAAVALLSMPLAVAFSRTVIFDAMLMWIETVALTAAWCGFEAKPERRQRWFALAWAMMGIGAVTKGPVAIVVPLLIVSAFGLVASVPLRPFFAWRAWPWLLLTALPWFVAVSLRRPDFPRYAFVYESLERFATSKAHRTGPWWFFVPIALAGSFPWCVPALAGLWRGARAWAARRTASSRPAVFLLTWALVPLLFFSLSQSKLPQYYLPALPALALGAGLMLSDAAPLVGAARPPWPIAVAATLLLLSIGFALGARHLPDTLPETVRSPLQVGAVREALVLLAAALVAGVAWLRGRPWLLAGAMALPMAAVPVVASDGLRGIAEFRSSRALAAAIERAAPAAAVLLVETLPTSLPWYLGRTLPLATDSGHETTSNYIKSRYDEFRTLPDSPLREANAWREALATCRTPTVFVVKRGRRQEEALAAALPRIGSGGASDKYAAYGPCAPPKTD